jgi:hypothetical protein
MTPTQKKIYQEIKNFISDVEIETDKGFYLHFRVLGEKTVNILNLALSGTTYAWYVAGGRCKELKIVVALYKKKK